MLQHFWGQYRYFQGRIDPSVLGELVCAQPITFINDKAEGGEEAGSDLSARRSDQQQSWKLDPGAWALNLLLITAPEVNEAFLQSSAAGAQGWEAQLGVEIGKESCQSCLGLENLPVLLLWDAVGCQMLLRSWSYTPCY